MAAVAGPDPDAGPIAGNFYPKYDTKNPIARHLVAGFMAAFDEGLARAGATDILEVGCGEGYLAARMAAGLAGPPGGGRVRGVDIGALALDEARRRAADLGLEIEFECRSVYDLAAPEDRAELIVAAELMEHLERPGEALARIADLAQAHVLLSVPREPVWRLMNLARGKYLSALGNTPGHVQNWSRAGFLALVRQHLEIVALWTPLPWVMVLGRPLR